MRLRRFSSTAVLHPPLAPDYGIEDDLAHFYFHQLLLGIVRGDIALVDTLMLTSASGSTGVHALTRHRPPRYQARKPPARFGGCVVLLMSIHISSFNFCLPDIRNAQDLRFWPLLRVQAERSRAEARRSMWQLAVHRSGGRSSSHPSYSLLNLTGLRMERNKPS